MHPYSALNKVVALPYFFPLIFFSLSGQLMYEIQHLFGKEGLSLDHSNGLKSAEAAQAAALPWSTGTCWTNTFETAEMTRKGDRREVTVGKEKCLSDTLSILFRELRQQQKPSIAPNSSYMWIHCDQNSSSSEPRPHPSILSLPTWPCAVSIHLVLGMMNKPPGVLTPLPCSHSITLCVATPGC